MASDFVKEQAKRRPIILSAKILPNATVKLLIVCVGGCAVFLEEPIFIFITYILKIYGDNLSTLSVLIYCNGKEEVPVYSCRTESTPYSNFNAT